MPTDEDIRLALRLRALADALLVPVATATGLTPELVQGFVEGTTTGAVAAAKEPTKKRKVSAYNRKYKAAFKRVSKKYKKKNGEWKKGGFKSAVRAAHKEAKK